MVNGNGWNKHEMLVMDKLDTLVANDKCIEKKIGDLRVDVAKLKVKAGIWGLLGGTIPVGIAILLFILKEVL